ncbi:MAG: hypothetical protein V4858_24815 [Pseudomonadota bacterium]
MSERAVDDPPALKDISTAHFIAGAWRPMLREVVRCFVEGDYGVTRGVAGVEPMSAAKAEGIRAYIAEYGTTLVELPEDTWQTSVAQWTGMGERWDILVDLWTAEEGRSDLVLDGWIAETDIGPRLTIHLVYVP